MQIYTAEDEQESSVNMFRSPAPSHIEPHHLNYQCDKDTKYYYLHTNVRSTAHGRVEVIF